MWGFSYAIFSDNLSSFVSDTLPRSTPAAHIWFWDQAQIVFCSKDSVLKPLSTTLLSQVTIHSRARRIAPHNIGCEMWWKRKGISEWNLS